MVKLVVRKSVRWDGKRTGQTGRTVDIGAGGDLCASTGYASTVGYAHTATPLRVASFSMAAALAK